MLDKIRKFLTSKTYLLANIILGALVTLTHQEVIGIAFFAILASFILIITEDAIAVAMPVLTACIFTLECYEDALEFVPVVVFILPLLLSVFLHITIYKKKLKIDKTFWGIVAVAVAVTLGGLGSISLKNYFQFASIFYVIGLGVGMICFYLVAKAMMNYSSKTDISHFFMLTMYAAGIFCCFMILKSYAANIEELIATKQLITELKDDPFRNVLSSFLILTMPFPFYFAVKNNIHVFSGLMIYVSTLLTGSRGGILFGSIQFALCMLFILIANEKSRLINISILAIIFTLFAVNIDKLEYFYSSRLQNGFHDFIKGDESRARLMLRAIDDFRAYPVFGRGLGYTGNQDIYMPKFFQMNWYHIMPFQIIGSLGTVGIIAYLYQFVDRFTLIFTKINIMKLVLGLSYFGIAMISLVEPGEFCPVPFEVIAVFLFIMIENNDFKEPVSKMTEPSDQKKITEKYSHYMRVENERD